MTLTPWSIQERDVRLGRLGLHVLDARRDGAAREQHGDRTVLFLHGMGAHGDAWRPVLRDLEGVDRVLCPDHRGHGRSDWSRDGYWLHDYATDAKELLDELEVEQVGVVGHSLGARVAMVLAPKLGSRLTSVALLDTGPEVSRSAALQARDQGNSKSQAVGFGSEEKLMAALRAEHPDFAQEQLEIRARTLYRLNWANRLLPRGDPEVFWLLGRAGLAEVDDMWAGLRETKAPALVLRATRSFLLDAELGGRMVDVLPDGRFQELELGHFMHYEDPALIARTLNDFHRTVTP